MLTKTMVALDQMNKDEIFSFLEKTPSDLKNVKIGLEAYLKYGPELVREVHERFQKDIFLDLKLHDIPVTVAKAIDSLQGLPIRFLTLHLGGGLSMLSLAKEHAKKSLPHTKLLGVSFLTSLSSDDLKETYGITNIDEAFLRLFKLADLAKIDGVVNSPMEIELLKKHFPNLLSVTPGIRFLDEIQSDVVQDQKRVLNPQEAIKLGADYLVIGRSLTKAKELSKRLGELSKLPHINGGK